VVAGNPANDWTRFYAGAHLWYSLALQDDPESFIPAAKLPLLGDAVNAACDGLDGMLDGVLQDPRNCDFDVGSLQCADDASSAACLTAKQVDAVRKIWGGVENASGHVVFPGLVPGGEAAPGGWSPWVTASEPFSSLHWRGGEGFFRFFVFDDPDWDFRSFDFDADLELALNKVGGAVDSSDPDISAFRDAGGKLIVYHGWSDPDISPIGSINYYDQVGEALAGGTGAQGAIDVDEFFRLFMVPGMGHCRGGPGVDQFDALTALEQWVENGKAPQQILASKVQDGVTVRTQPLCPYPEAAVWDGESDSSLASSFRCALP
jgi:feruloyl esterase